jgi:hypothetical protein
MGTSMAAPHASGVAGLVWSHLLATDPAHADAATVRQHLQDCADAVGALGQNMLAWSHYGRLNARAALDCGGTEPPPPPPSGDPVPPVHVADLDGASAGAGPVWSAQATVLVVDSVGAPVEGARVDGSWTDGDGTTPTSCTTDAAGTCSVSSSDLRKKVATVTYRVTGIAGFAYDPGANQDPDGDSDGTSLTIGKP